MRWRSDLASASVSPMNSDARKETSSGWNEKRVFTEPSSNVAMTSGMESNMPAGIGRGIWVMVALTIFMGLDWWLDVIGLLLKVRYFLVSDFMLGILCFKLWAAMEMRCDSPWRTEGHLNALEDEAFTTGGTAGWNHQYSAWVMFLPSLRAAV